VAVKDEKPKALEGNLVKKKAKQVEQKKIK